MAAERLDGRHHREPPLRAPRRLPARGAGRRALHLRRAAARPARRPRPDGHRLADRRRRVRPAAPARRRRVAARAARPLRTTRTSRSSSSSGAANDQRPAAASSTAATWDEMPDAGYPQARAGTLRQEPPPEAHSRTRGSCPLASAWSQHSTRPSSSSASGGLSTQRSHMGLVEHFVLYEREQSSASSIAEFTRSRTAHAVSVAVDRVSGFGQYPGTVTRTARPAPCRQESSPA